MTSLTHGGDELEATNVAISSLVDTFVLLGWVRSEGERNRRLNIVKSRGMAHSNQTREFRITSAGIQIQDVYTGAGGLTGAAREAQEARERAEAARLAQDVERRRALVRTRQEAFEARMRSLAGRVRGRAGGDAAADRPGRSVASERHRGVAGPRGAAPRRS